jgi:cytidine deaminase
MEDLEEMIRRAREAMAKAYAPYSRFPVGACVRGASGALYAGCNVENASFPEGWCAETSALASLVLAGERSIEAAVVVTAGDEPCSPCGGCRQRLSEFASPKTPVVLCFGEDGRQSTTIGELLPLAFDGHLLPGS